MDSMPGTVDDLRKAGAAMKEAQQRVQAAARATAAAIAPKPATASPAASEDHDKP